MGTVTKKTIGKNKCGMGWKKGSVRSEFQKKPPSDNYARRMEEKARMERIKAKTEALKNSRAEVKRRAKERRKEKEERKRINEFKSSTYQVINNLAKTKKWNRKARKTLAKMPAEAFYAKFGE